MSATSLPVLYEDNHLLVVNKPAGLATMGAEHGEVTAVDLAAAYIKAKYHKPGNVFVGVVSRLDRMVSGVLVLARTSKGASRLAEQFRDHTTCKQYVAWIEGQWPWREETELNDWLYKDEAAQRMRAVAAQRPHAQPARLEVRPVLVQPQRSLLAITLHTGRKHQIRVQLAAQGHPILGDRKYDASTHFPYGIALHSWRLGLKHPTRPEQLSFIAAVPEYWPGSSAIYDELPSQFD